MPGTKPLITYSEETLAAAQAASKARDNIIFWQSSGQGIEYLSAYQREYQNALIALHNAVSKDLNRYRVGTP